jgi:glycosyltransferase involved in cell wall biosynthesis
MTNRRLRVLYLGNAMQKGWGGRLPTTHVYSGEIFLMQKLSNFAEVSTVGLISGRLWEKRFEALDDTPGLEHELLLWDRNPALWHRWASWRNLRNYYLAKVRQGKGPDVIVVRNLQHVFNYFVNWLRKQPGHPPIVLLLGDSGGLGEKFSWWRRFRYHFKPMQMLEDVSLLEMYDGAILSGISAKKYFEPRGVPWVWHPAIYKFEYTPPPPRDDKGPIRFGYFGRLFEYYGIIEMVNAFLKSKIPGSLHICGFGKEMSVELRKLASIHPTLHFDGFLPKESDCLDWAQQVDVLINSRLPLQGQDNSFPSRVLEYGIAAKAIISTRVGGAAEAIGEEGIYLDARDFEKEMEEKFREVAGMDRPELQRRGRAIRDRILKEFSGDEQARRVFELLEGIVNKRNASGTPE